MPVDAPLLRRLKDGADDFSKNQRMLARYVLKNHEAVAFQTVSELAAQSGVSEATVVRFAKALDFSGYPAFQKEIRRMLRANLRGNERFRLGAEPRAAHRTPLDAVIEKERENISALYDAFDARAFASAARMLRRASEAMIVGTRSTASLSWHLWFALDKIAVPAIRVSSITSETYDRVSRMDKGACVVVIGFPRYLREHVKLIEFAKSRRLATLTITDSTYSPLQGDVTLLAPAESASFVAFHCAPLILINALVHEVSVADSTKTLEALRRFEVVAEAQQYFLKD